MCDRCLESPTRQKKPQAMASKQNPDAYKIIEEYCRALDRICSADMLHWKCHLQALIRNLPQPVFRTGLSMQHACSLLTIWFSHFSGCSTTCCNDYCTG